MLPKLSSTATTKYCQSINFKPIRLSLNFATVIADRSTVVCLSIPRMA
jgi:hypothetical protein